MLSLPRSAIGPSFDLNHEVAGVQEDKRRGDGQAGSVKEEYCSDEDDDYYPGSDFGYYDGLEA